MRPRTKYWLIHARSLGLLGAGVLGSALLLRADERTWATVVFLATVVVSFVVWATVDLRNARRLPDV